MQEAGTRNVVVTTTYENGVTKDVTTPYTVLDFLGKQDKKINQNQSGQLGDARNYVTVSDNSAVPGELTVRWKGGSSKMSNIVPVVNEQEDEFEEVINSKFDSSDVLDLKNYKVEDKVP